MLNLQTALRHAIPATFVACLALAIPLSLWPHTRTAGYVAAAPLTGHSLLDGSWMKSAEVALQESSYLALQARALYAENTFRLGLLDSPRVAYGRNGWFYFRTSLTVDRPAFDQAAAARTQFLSDLRGYVDRLGVEVIVVPVPDKELVYPEHIYPEGRLPDDRAFVYAQGVRELLGAGFATVPVLDLLLESKRTRPDTLLFLERDTHWSLDGAAAVALAVNERLRASGPADRLGAPVPYHPTPVMDTPVPGDLLLMLGFRPWGNRAGLPALANRGFGLWLDGQPVELLQPQARMALCGTSFSDVHFGLALCAATLVSIDREGVRVGGGSFKGLLSTLAAIERGEKQARIVVWEFVARDLMWEWRTPPQVPR